MILTLSELPPPLSACFINAGKSRIKSPRYKAWQWSAGLEIKPQLKAHQTIMIPVIVTYRVKRKVNKDGSISKVNQDLDNLCKALGDILTTSQVIEDDSLIHDLRIVWADSIQKSAVEITVDLM